MVALVADAGAAVRRNALPLTRSATIPRKDSVYPTVLTIHSWLRWAALLLGVIATFNAFRHRADTAERPRGQRWDWGFMLALDLQALFGLLLYFGLSPFTREAINNVGMALRDPGLRFWAITHVAMMVVALVAVRAGRVFAMGEQDIPRTTERTLHLLRDRGARDGGRRAVAGSGERKAVVQVLIVRDDSFGDIRTTIASRDRRP